MSLTASGIARAARAHGFARAAVLPINAPLSIDRYQAWLAAGYHGDLAYLANPEQLPLRADVRLVYPEAKALIAVALAYPRDVDVPADRLLRGRIARYARGDDYHIVLRDRLLALTATLEAELGQPIGRRTCVDSAPVLERAWAERAGLGFIGKHTLVIAPGAGSYVLLGELAIDAEVTFDEVATPTAPRCGRCTACLDACPTRAFVDAFVLDARRCISYLTIENAGAIPIEFRAAIGSWIFGCDLCQEACPFNAGKLEPALALPPRSHQHALPDLLAMATAPSNQLRQFVKRTALRRVGRAQLLRNVAVALGNSADARALDGLRVLAASSYALVRSHAAWALGELVAHLPTVKDHVAGPLTVLAADAEADVRAEAALALARPALLS